MLRVIAKGAHRRTKVGASRFDGGIDFLDLGDAVFTADVTRDLATLTEWHLVDGHLELRGNLRAIYLGLYAAELVSLLIEEHDAHPELFDLLENTVQQLATDRLEEKFLVFQLDLLRLTGYSPRLDACGICGEELDSASAFSPAEGSVVCQACSAPDRINIDSRLIRLMRNILREPGRLPRLTRHQTDPINRLLLQYVQHTLGRRLYMGEYVAG
jgi:DNA repair protein RecO